MLKSSNALRQPDMMLSMIAVMNGNSGDSKELAEGVFEVGHFGSSHWPSGYERYPENLTLGCYGVCDHWEQVVEKCPELADPNREFAITVTPIVKAEQPSEGGWRWHKWGEYIGNQEPVCEYIHDEPKIERVYCYHIYERV